MIKNNMNIFSKKSFKGYVLAGLAALSVSLVYVFSKKALNVTPLFTFGFWWFLMSFLYNLGWVIYTRRIRLLRLYESKKIRILFIIGFLEFLASITFYQSLHEISNPAVVSFLVNTIPVFVTLLSIPLLNERFNIFEALGMIITMGGAFMLSYSGKFTLDGLLIKGAYLTILSCVISAMSLVVAKKNIKKIDPYLISFTRSGILSSLYFVGMISLSPTMQISVPALINCALGAFFGPFLASILQYNAFKYIEVSKESLIQNAHGVFVVISAFLIMNIMPAAIQIIGGIVAITGVSIMVFGKLYYSKLVSLQKSLFLLFLKNNQKL